MAWGICCHDGYGGERQCCPAIERSGKERDEKNPLDLAIRWSLVTSLRSISVEGGQQRLNCKDRGVNGRGGSGDG